MGKAKGTYHKCGKHAKKWAGSSFLLMKLMLWREIETQICTKQAEEFYPHC
jgi:hypothetical protein